MTRQKGLKKVEESNFLAKIEAKYAVLSKTEAVRLLMQAFYQTLGNKRYLHDLEALFNEKLSGLTPHEEQTLMHLMRDLKEFGMAASRHAREAKQGWHF